MKLKNKKAFITGGSSGIGAAIATLFAKEGADISFCYFKDETKAINPRMETKYFTFTGKRKYINTFLFGNINP